MLGLHWLHVGSCSVLRLWNRLAIALLWSHGIGVYHGRNYTSVKIISSDDVRINKEFLVNNNGEFLGPHSKHNPEKKEQARVEFGHT